MLVLVLPVSVLVTGFLKIYKNTPHSDKHKVICSDRIREVHCFDCKYPSDIDQKFHRWRKTSRKNKIYFGKIPEKHWNYKTDDVFTYTPGIIKYDAKINKNNIISGGIKHKRRWKSAAVLAAIATIGSLTGVTTYAADSVSMEKGTGNTFLRWRDFWSDLRRIDSRRYSWTQ